MRSKIQNEAKFLEVDWSNLRLSVVFKMICIDSDVEYALNLQDSYGWLTDLINRVSRHFITLLYA
jgi:hypothetical protein